MRSVADDLRDELQDEVRAGAEPWSPTLEELLERITDENLHQEVETGPAAGNEMG